jgi:hypothetical protein
MSLAIRRSKMISFRLSPEEYQTLQAACTDQHVRSISDGDATDYLAARPDGPAIR